MYGTYVRCDSRVSTEEGFEATGFRGTNAVSFYLLDGKIIGVSHNKLFLFLSFTLFRSSCMDECETSSRLILSSLLML